MRNFKKNPYLYEYKTSINDYIYINFYTNQILKIYKNEKHDFDKLLIKPNEKELTTLLTNKILVPQNFNIKVENQKIFRDFYEKKEKLQLIILPTERCNFRCKYCYENHVPGTMNKDTIEGIVNFVREKLPAYKYLQVEWFGGEPLIEKNIIEKLSDKLRLLCKEFKKPYFASMTTNGYSLTREIFKSMISNKITNYQITLDGLAFTHNKYRHLVNGKGTFDVILNNLKRIRDEEKSRFINIIIRCNITRPILNNFDNYVDLLEKEFSNDSRFSFLWKIAWNPTPELKNEEYCKTENLEKLLKKYQKRKLLFTTFIEQLKKYGMVCYGGNPHSYVIRSTGIISKCTVDFDNKLNNLGTLKRNEKIIINNNINYWTKPNLDFVCLKCFLFPSCLGIHCPKKNRDEYGNRLCPISKKEINSYFEYISNNKNLYIRLNDLWEIKK